MSFELQRVSPIKYHVVNKGTGLIHSHFNRKKKGQAQIRLLNMLHEQHGEGNFFSDMVQGAKKIAFKVFKI